MNADEKQLLEDVFARVPGAFEQLLQRYRALVFSVFHSPGFDVPRDQLDDLFQSFVVALASRDFRKLRSFEGRNDCSLATFLQVVATRFALDERRRWRRQPRGVGEAGRDADEPGLELADPDAPAPDRTSLDQERLDIFYNLLFSLDWKRISAVLWVFRGVPRERIAEVMATSRANIDALYKRAKDQMAELYGQGAFRRPGRRADPEVLTAAVSERLTALLPVPTRRLDEALLRPGGKRLALLGLVLLDYPRFLASRSELARLADVPPEELEQASLGVLDEVCRRVGA
jgi:RNA polymerase sigma factor (sigma-70 family)